MPKTEAKVLDKDGKEQSISVEDITKKAVDEALRAVSGPLSEFGEQLAGPLKDTMEEGLENIAKKLERNEPLNAERGFGAADLDFGGAHAPVDERTKNRAVSEYIAAVGQAKTLEEAAELVATRQLNPQTRAYVEKLLTESEMSRLGILVPDQVRGRIIELRENANVVRRMAGEALTVRGNLLLPKELSTATAYYKGEAENLSITNFERGQDQLGLKKLTCLVAASNELLTDGVNIQPIIDRQMQRALSRKEGDSFLQGIGSENVPKGIMNQVAAANQNAASGTTVQNIRNDLVQALVALRADNFETGSAAWIFNSTRWGGFMNKLANDSSMAPFATEILAGRLMGLPYFETNHIVENSGSDIGLFLRDAIIVIDAVDFHMDASQEASFIDDDSNQVSAYSKDLTVWRMIYRSNVRLEEPEAGYIITGANY